MHSSISSILELKRSNGYLCHRDTLYPSARTERSRGRHRECPASGTSTRSAYLRGSGQEGREVDGDDEQEDPDAEVGHPLDVLGQVVGKDGREHDARKNVDALANAERHRNYGH